MSQYKKLIKLLLAHQQWIALTLLSICLIIGYFSYQHFWLTDLTHNQRNSLTSESQKVLAEMPEDVEIKAFSSNTPSKGKYFRKSITTFINRYQQYKSNVYIHFIDPITDAKEAIRLGLKQEGDMVVSYQRTHELFALPYTEERFTNLLMKLHTSKKRTFLFTQHHQEPLLSDSSIEGWSKLAEYMRSNDIAFTQSDQISQLTQDHILVVNAPRKPFSSGELHLMQQHIKKGGNFIWLFDSANLQGLEKLLDDLNIEISQGVTVDLSNQTYGLDPRVVSASRYANHEIFSDFTLRTFFPSARRVSSKAGMNSSWKFTQLIGVAENGWLTKSEPKTLAGDALANNIDRNGPINIAISLERQLNQQQQRILVIGSSKFLSNGYITHGGNLELARQLLQWTSMSYNPIALKPQLTKDSIVMISDDSFNRHLILVIFNSFQFLLPALLLCAAIFIWLRKAKM